MSGNECSRSPSRRPPTIIVGYDGSEPAMRALERVARLAGPGSRVVVIAVAAPYPRAGVTIPANEDAAESRRRREQLDDAAAFLARHGLKPSTKLLRGDPADVLLDAARDADLAVVGGRRLSRFARLMLGSVSSRLVSDAGCDVLVVR